jgi:formylglycine-generating enzyme required for sulfatase activity
MRLRSATRARLVLAGMALIMVSARPAAAQSVIRDSIPGTLVSFELVQVDGVPGARNEAPKKLLVGRTEVTWDMYDVFMHRLDTTRTKGAADALARPSQPYAVPDYEWGHAGYAAISITYHAAKAFTEWLSAKTGHRYRLPTELEWEFIAGKAAGGQGQLPKARIDAIAWHADNANRQAHPIASKQPDALGLYDFFGNVAEWVQSTPPTLVTRGGSFRDEPATLGPRARAVQNGTWTERDPHLPTSTWWLTDGPMVGFRIVRDP